MVALGTGPHTLPLHGRPVFVAKNGEQGMHQVYDVLSTHESRFAPTSMPVNPSTEVQAEHPSCCLCSGRGMEHTGPAGRRPGAQLGEGGIASTALPVHESAFPSGKRR